MTTGPQAVARSAGGTQTSHNRPTPRRSRLPDAFEDLRRGKIEALDRLLLSETPSFPIADLN